MFVERRSHFRVDIIDPVKAVARLVSINGAEAPVQKLIEINVRDLSAGGMKIETLLDLPTNIKIVLRVSFDFEEQHFDVLGIILRKKKLAGELKEYGVKFIGISRLEEYRLVRCLNQYKIKNVKSKKSQVDLRKQKGIGPMVKMIEAMDFPAYLVTAQRVVVAANRTALAEGAHLGERCYLTVCQNKKVCSFCQIDKAQSSEDILSTQAYVRNDNRTVNWIYLENGLTLHYLK
jgi:hypothetical protein